MHIPRWLMAVSGSARTARNETFEKTIATNPNSSAHTNVVGATSRTELKLALNMRRVNTAKLLAIV